MQSNPVTGVIIMTYGSATTSDNVEAYFKRIYGEKASPELIADFANRYDAVGGSPLITITKEQARLTQEALGEGFLVRAGMRHSEPFIAEAVYELKMRGASKLVGIILSPQFSPFIMEGYKRALMEAAKENGYAPESLRVVGPWASEPAFIELLASRTKEKLAFLRERYLSVPVVFTTHSLPKRVVEKDSAYLAQIEETAGAVIAAINDPSMEWYRGYQSAGHTPEEWLKPDLTDILAMQKENGAEAVLIVPLQFLADHLEILYDLDIAARAQCEEYGIAYNRIELPNTDPRFIRTLANLARSA